MHSHFVHNVIAALQNRSFRNSELIEDFLFNLHAVQYFPLVSELAVDLASGKKDYSFLGATVAGHDCDIAPRYYLNQ